MALRNNLYPGRNKAYSHGKTSNPLSYKKFIAVTNDKDQFLELSLIDKDSFSALHEEWPEQEISNLFRLIHTYKFIYLRGQEL